jgi:hypothetical protein
MILPETPEGRCEIERQLDADNFIAEDACRKTGTLADIARILIRTARSLTKDQKAEIRGDCKDSDKKMLRQKVVCSGNSKRPSRHPT